MSYCFQPDSPVKTELRRIAVEQLSSAIDDIDDDSLDRNETVHSIRKRCKKLRGLIRLVRPAFPDFSAENKAVRDVAAALSRSRDAHAMIETFDDLMQHVDLAGHEGRFSAVREGLVHRRDAVEADSESLEARLAEGRRSLVDIRERAGTWRLRDSGFSALAGGLKLTYGRARADLAALGGHPSVEALHELRKRVKYHGYHLRLLAPVWPPVMRSAQDEMELLESHLGDDHNLALLRDLLCGSPDQFGSVDIVSDLIVVIERRREELQAAAIALGGRALTEKPSRLVQRIGGYWSATRKQARRDATRAEAAGGGAADEADAAEHAPEAMEIERKFRVSGEGWRAAATRQITIRQGYIVNDDTSQVRVRIEDGSRAFMTMKSAADTVERTEIELLIEVAEAERLLGASDGQIIEKIRHIVPAGELTWEIDEFVSPELGLVLAELELSRADQPFDRPGWLGEEVTGDARFYNRALSRQGVEPIAAE